MLKERYPKKVSLNLLWGLEAAILGVDWRELTETDKEELKKKLMERELPCVRSITHR